MTFTDPTLNISLALHQHKKVEIIESKLLNQQQSNTQYSEWLEISWTRFVKWMTVGYVQVTFIFISAASSLLVSLEAISQQYQNWLIMWSAHWLIFSMFFALPIWDKRYSKDIVIILIDLAKTFIVCKSTVSFTVNVWNLLSFKF